MKFCSNMVFQWKLRLNFAKTEISSIWTCRPPASFNLSPSWPVGISVQDFNWGWGLRVQYSCKMSNFSIVATFTTENILRDVLYKRKQNYMSIFYFHWTKSVKRVNDPLTCSPTLMIAVRRFPSQSRLWIKIISFGDLHYYEWCYLKAVRFNFLLCLAQINNF